MKGGAYNEHPRRSTASRTDVCLKPDKDGNPWWIAKEVCDILGYGYAKFRTATGKDIESLVNVRYTV